MRMRLVVKQLTERGWRKYLDRVAPNVMRWLDEVAIDATAPAQLPFLFLRDQLLAHDQILRDVAAARAGTGALLRKSAEAGADEAARLLAETILPNGIDSPLDGRSILLGGWQHAFTEHGDGPDGIIAALTDSQLQELVGKAIEMSVVARIWEGDT
jgi:hypothetical protein